MRGVRVIYCWATAREMILTLLVYAKKSRTKKPCSEPLKAA
jgi:hypothetical protein